MANALAYYGTATITAVKSFIVQAPGVKVIKRNTSKFTNVRNKPECLFLASLSFLAYD